MNRLRIVAAAIALTIMGCGSDTSTVTDSSPRPGGASLPVSIPAAPTQSGTAPETPVTEASTGTEPVGAVGRHSESPCGWGGAPPATYDHVIWVWMENHRADQVLDTPKAPYETGLSQQCGRAADYRQVGKPSLPNYLGATSGSTWGVSDDDAPSGHVITDDNLFRQVRATGRTAMSFQESMTSNCAVHSDGTYAVKHNPAAYYQGADDRQACQRDNVALGTVEAGPFHDALANGTLPAFSFVTPDLCNDTHDCQVDVGDRWLTEFLSSIFASMAYQSGRTAVFLVWDEDQPMPFIPMAPAIAPGTVLDATVDHYALLRTTEEMLGITDYLGNAADAPSMREGFNL